MDDGEEDANDRRGIIVTIKTIILSPFHILTSRPALRTYLRTLLLFLTSLALLTLSILAYASFYYAYIPARGLQVPVHLQFDPTNIKFPYGVAQIGKNGVGLASRQRYDVTVKLDMPRTEANLRVGNWMVEVVLRGPDEARSILESIPGITSDSDEVWDIDGSTATPNIEPAARSSSSGTGTEKVSVLARSRRPAILTYRSRIVELAYKISRLPWYIIGWGQEAETVEIGMMEGVEFDKGWRNLPSSLRLEIRSRETMQVYKVSVKFTARFEGLRYIMYNHRILSALLFISSFYTVSMTLLFTTWALLSFLFSLKRAPPPSHLSAKSESESQPPLTPLKTESEPATPLSDSSRTFPTLSRHHPLHYSSSSARLKEEVKEEGWRDDGRRLEDIPRRPEGDADDEEDEDADFVLEEPGTGYMGIDSGLGTSMESSVEREKRGVRRRSGGGPGRD